MGLKLFDASESDNEDVSKIEINREYAKRYEHNKKREDLHRLEEMKKKGFIQDSDSESESSSSEEEDEDSNNLLKSNVEFFDTLIKIKKQDPIIKQKDVKLFDSEESEKSEQNNGVRDHEKGKKKKSMYLKDVVAKHLIEEGPEFVDKESLGLKSYNDEQEEIRKAFLEAVKEDDEEEEGLLKVKEIGGREEEEEEEVNGDLEQKLDEYFGQGDGELDENARFLKEYFMNKLWLDKDKGKDRKVKEEELEMVSEDDAEIERQEEYEHRFQENVGDRILGHSRKTEGSVRKKKNARKDQRKSKEERMEIARIKREEELKHLKNLKKDEVKEKLRKIRETAGIEDEICLLNAKDLDEEFDPKEYDRMMKAAFGEEYYEKDDVDPNFGSDEDDADVGEIDKPDFEEEDELLGLPEGWDKCGSSDGFLAARERSLKHKIDDPEDEDEEEEEEQIEEDEEEEDGDEEKKDDEDGKRKRKRKLALYKKAREAMMEEYYKLDYEDTIGDLKTRFKYAKIKPNRYGMSSAEILAMDDKELNQYVSLKKLAPYKEEEWKVPNSTRYQMKMRAKELLRGGKIEKQKGGKKRRSKDDVNNSTSLITATDDKKKQVEEPNSDMANMSRTARRRRRQAELKLSHSRLWAYGKIDSKPKKKAKH